MKIHRSQLAEILDDIDDGRVRARESTVENVVAVILELPSIARKFGFSGRTGKITRRARLAADFTEWRNPALRDEPPIAQAEVKVTAQSNGAAATTTCCGDQLEHHQHLAQGSPVTIVTTTARKAGDAHVWPSESSVVTLAELADLVREADEDFPDPQRAWRLALGLEEPL